MLEFVLEVNRAPRRVSDSSGCDATGVGGATSATRRGRHLQVWVPASSHSATRWVNDDHGGRRHADRVKGCC